MINEIFDWCVQFLVFWAGRLGMSYKAINVWVFVIIWPVFTLLLIGLVIAQQVRDSSVTQAGEKNIKGG